MAAKKATKQSKGVTRLSKKPARGEGDPRLTLRIDFGAHGALGPGKIRLLEEIGRVGSISAAGRSMDMSYRKAWLLLDSINSMFAERAVGTQHGGAGGGAATLTKFGESLIAQYRGIEREVERAAQTRLRTLQRALAPEPPAPTEEATE